LIIVKIKTTIRRNKVIAKQISYMRKKYVRIEIVSAFCFPRVRSSIFLTAGKRRGTLAQLVYRTPE
jgi:hypothetical protein